MTPRLKRSFFGRVLRTCCLELAQEMIGLAEALTIETATEITRADAESAIVAQHIRNSVELSGWPAATADCLIAANVGAREVDQLLSRALRGPVQ